MAVCTTGHRAVQSTLAAAIAMACGCAFSSDQLHADLRRRAAYDFNCPPESLSIVDLSESQGGNVNSAGVSGCGKRATYVRPLNNTAWVLNAVDGQPAASPNTNQSPNGPVQKEANQ
jgi:hypothetical protein